MAKVLLVEDDNNLREIYEARLQAEGYEVVSASDGEQALVVAKTERPELVISDVMMPKISGFEMLDILRNTDGLKDVKVIMLTALGQAEDKTRADQLGANKYLVKSQVTLEDIVKTAHQLLDDEPEPVAATPAPATPTDGTTPAQVASAPAATPDPTPATTPAPTTDAPETESQEQAAMTAQIDNFVGPAAAPAPTVPTTPTAPPVSVSTPTPTATPAPDPTAPTSDNDQLVSDALKALDGDQASAKPSEIAAVEVPPEPTPQAPVAAVASTTPEPNVAVADNNTAVVGNDTVTATHNKVIQPISDPTNAKPDINDLLAAEEAKAAAVAAASAQGAAADPATAPVTVGGSAPTTPTPQAGPDPNSIAL